MTPTQQQIEAVRRDWPHWTDAQIIRHLKDRQRLSQIAEQQRQARFADALRGWV